MPHTTGTLIGTGLRRTFRGSVWEEGDDGYDQARTLWNGAVDGRPSVVARCADADDARTALLAARHHGLGVSVRGGGHDWAGRAVRDHGVVIDLSALRGVRIDAAGEVADVQGGVLAADLVDAAGQHGLVAAAGAVSGVGMIGMTMAGGYGGLIGRFGLALDNLISADVVLADGSTVRAAEDGVGDPELLWALRGGGGNFGVVTSARIRVHRLGPVLGGMVMYPFEQAPQALRGYREVIADGPDELTVMAGIVTGPAGGPIVFLAPTWSGDPTEGEAAVAALTRLGKPLMANVAPMPYGHLLRMFDAGSAAGNQYALGTRWLPELSDDSIAAFCQAAIAKSSPMSLLALHQFHGAAARVAPDATAFAQRHDHLLAEVIAAWPAGEDGDRHREWARETASALEPGAVPGGYPNILGPDEADRVGLGFAGNLDRLHRAKQRYDPDGIFSAVAALTR